MTAPTLTAEYIPGLGMPAVCVDGHPIAVSVEAAETFITDFQYALLRARIDAKKLSTARRRLGTPENEMEQLLQMVDLQLATPETFPKSSPASEVTP